MPTALSLLLPTGENVAQNLPSPPNEISRLRTECASLGEKLRDTNLIEVISKSERSHYDPQTNHCYIELKVHVADEYEGHPFTSTNRFLYDGQTGGTLAETHAVEGGLKSGEVWDRVTSQHQKWDPT